MLKLSTFIMGLSGRHNETLFCKNNVFFFHLITYSSLLKIAILLSLLDLSPVGMRMKTMDNERKCYEFYMAFAWNYVLCI